MSAAFRTELLIDAELARTCACGDTTVDPDCRCDGREHNLPGRHAAHPFPQSDCSYQPDSPWCPIHGYGSSRASTAEDLIDDRAEERADRYRGSGAAPVTPWEYDR